MNQPYYVLIEHLRQQVSESSYIMLAAAREAAKHVQGDVVALLLGHEAQPLAAEVAADRVLYWEDPSLAEFNPEPYISLICQQIQQAAPRVVLFGHTSIGMDVACAVSARLNLPLVSQCLTLVARDDELGYLSRICGGKLMVEGALPGPTALITLVPGGYKPEMGRSSQPPPIEQQPMPELPIPRITLARYIEPEAGDVDIRKVPRLIAIGRGLQNSADLELVEELAQALNGELCASRPIIDQRWLPASRLVGKSGMTVRPKLYLALGISGAPEHVEGITGSELIIAVNTDPDAPIFEVAQYGIVGDMLDFVEALTEEMEHVRMA